MCGLFGVSRVNRNAEPDKVFSALTVGLGIRSEERGRHAAGVGIISDSQISSIVVHKETKPFRNLNFNTVGSAILGATTILGHTRYATQGSKADINNASPMKIGNICGTHNGDLDKVSITTGKVLSLDVKKVTDTAVLFAALEGYIPGSKEFMKILSQSTGRMALAFVHTQMPNALILVRGAISPLSYAYTQNGSLVYASNPNWFRQIEEKTNGEITFSRITLIPEGQMLVFDVRTNKLVASYDFVPQCRERDLYYVNSSAYKNFVSLDKSTFNSLTHRRIVSPSLPKKPQAKIVTGFIKEAVEYYEDFTDVLFDAAFLRGESDVPFSSPRDDATAEEFRISQENIETLCSIPREFDEAAYIYIHESDDEYELEYRYREVIAQYTNDELLSDGELQRLGLPEPLALRDILV